MNHSYSIILSIALVTFFSTGCGSQGIVNPDGPPVAKAGASSLSVWVGETVIFYDNGSFDPDGGQIAKYEWDWDFDGTFDAEGDFVSHSWLNAGTILVGFRVTDDEGETTVLEQPLVVKIKAAEFNFEIDATKPWVSTGVFIPEGAELTFTASGTAWFSFPLGEGATGPEGQWTGIDGPMFTDTALAQGPLAQLADDGRYYFYALVARIGDDVPIYVGSQRKIIANIGGMLALTANDQACCYGDNSGSWQVALKIGE